MTILRMRRLLLPAALLAGALIATAVWATTPHTITVDGDLGDFAADEKTTGDPAGDSIYGANNDLTTLHVTWDAQKLYLGFGYKAEQTAVIYLIDTGKTGGVSNLCKSAGYNGSFPANVSGPDFDLMIALFAPADHGTPSAPYVYTLGAGTSTDITSSTGVQAKLVETVATAGRDGKVEAAIPWDTIYGLGAGKVPTGATLKIAGVLRGKSDGDGLGDASPDPTGGVKNVACGAQGTVLDKLHTITVDASGDGVPDNGWAPGPNTPKTDGGPLPDQAQLVDKGPLVDKPASGDRGPDGTPVVTGDGAIRRDLTRLPDKRIIKADAGGKKSDEGCACAVSAAPPADVVLLLGLLAIWATARPRRRR